MTPQLTCGEREVYGGAAQDMIKLKQKHQITLAKCLTPTPSSIFATMPDMRASQMKSFIAIKEYLVWKDCEFTPGRTISGDCQGTTILSWIKMKTLMLSSRILLVY